MIALVEMDRRNAELPTLVFACLRRRPLTVAIHESRVESRLGVKNAAALLGQRFSSFVDSSCDIPPRVANRAGHLAAAIASGCP